MCVMLSWFCSYIPFAVSIFQLFIISIAHFSIEIPFLYTDFMAYLFIWESPILFLFSWKQLDVVNVHKEIELFL